MCGICGIVNYKRPVSKDTVQGMMTPMAHRGPDDSGIEVFKTEKCMIGFGHVRLSILDLSPMGHQPMKYGNLTIVLNGEVYNFREIREKLEGRGHSFKSNSDTEVVLHSFKEWGMGCVERFIGMFAFAIYDELEHKIFCCRDRAGIKPFFYYQDDNCFSFGSELKCIMSTPDVDKTIDNESLSLYMQLGYVPTDKCILQKAHKLEAGHWLVYDVENREITIEKYWDIDDYFSKPKLQLSYHEAKEQLRAILKSAFAYRMIADVPVGVFLSGGFDSSAVCAILTKELGITPRTFTIGFDFGQNEAPDAEEIAKYLGTDHQSYYCTTQDVLDIVPNLPYYFDEPSSDISAIPTTLVSKITREHVTVALSADGGDEIFAGYYTYQYIANWLGKLNKMPKILQNSFGGIPYHLMYALTPSKRTVYHWALDTLRGYYKGKERNVKALVSNTLNWEDVICSRILKDYRNASNRYFNYSKTDGNSLDYLMALNFKVCMRDLLCAKVDRASMTVSLESREPMLDHRIAEFGAQLPLEYKYKNGVKKRILKDLVYDYIPQSIMDKPKKGFNIPLGHWLQTDLKDYVYDNMTAVMLEKTGFNAPYVLKMLDNNLNKGYHYGYMFRGYSGLVWRILQYQLWYKLWIEGKK